MCSSGKDRCMKNDQINALIANVTSKNAAAARLLQRPPHAMKARGKLEQSLKTIEALSSLHGDGRDSQITDVACENACEADRARKDYQIAQELAGLRRGDVLSRLPARTIGNPRN